LHEPSGPDAPSIAPGILFSAAIFLQRDIGAAVRQNGQCDAFRAEGFCVYALKIFKKHATFAILVLLGNV